MLCRAAADKLDSAANREKTVLFPGWDDQTTPADEQRLQADAIRRVVAAIVGGNDADHGVKSHARGTRIAHLLRRPHAGGVASRLVPCFARSHAESLALSDSLYRWAVCSRTRVPVNAACTLRRRPAAENSGERKRPVVRRTGLKTLQKCGPRSRRKRLPPRNRSAPDSASRFAPGSAEDPGVDHVGDLGHQRQVVAAEAGRVLPLVAVLVETADGHVEHAAVLGFVLPDRGLDPAEPNLVNRFPFDFSFSLGMAMPSFRDCRNTEHGRPAGRPP